MLGLLEPHVLIISLPLSLSLFLATFLYDFVKLVFVFLSCSRFNCIFLLSFTFQNDRICVSHVLSLSLPPSRLLSSLAVRFFNNILLSLCWFSFNILVL